MRTIFLLISVLLFSCSTSQRKNHATTTNEKNDSVKCIVNFTVEHTRYNGRYQFRSYETQGIIHAVDFNSAKGLLFLQMNHPADDIYEKLIAIDTTTNKLCVNATCFSDLVMVDATRLQDRHIVGEVKPELMQKINYRQLITFLLKTEIIQSYWHLSADICLKKESEYAEFYEAEYTAVHHYCTNECIDQPYMFTVVINKNTGVIELRP